MNKAGNSICVRLRPIDLKPKLQCRDSGRRGFTLIELLVVVSIIALLISILLPSLKKARDQAKSITCSSTIGGILRGMNVYASEWNGWIPGSPGTSGSVLLGDADIPSDIYAEDIPGNITQTWDWAGPVTSSKLPDNRGTRMRTIAEEVYVCPANQYTSEPFPDGPKGTFVNQRMMSYNTVRQYLLWSPEHPLDFDVDYKWGDPAPFPEADFRYNLGGAELPPASYVPNLGRVINPSSHVYIADGSRYTDVETGSAILDHDVDWNPLAGGAFSDGGPTLPELYLRAYRTEDQWAPYSYRHSKSGDKGAIVTGRFDGSAGVLGRRESRFPDWWWPRGTLIPYAQEFNAEVKQLYPANSTGYYSWRVYN